MGRTNTPVLTNVQHSQVLDAVVARVAIDVVNMLGRQEFPSQVGLHDVPVLMLTDSVDGRADVCSPPVRSLEQRVAVLTTKPLELEPAWGQSEDGSALCATSRKSRSVMSLLPSDGLESGHFDSGKLRLGKTRARAEARRGDTVGWYIEDHAAHLTAEIGSIAGRHRATISDQKQAVAIALSQARRAGKKK